MSSTGLATHPATDALKPDRRTAILDAAAHVISERGVDRARLADIAEMAGVSLGLVQHYFRRRSTLLVATFERESERIATVWGSVISPDAPPLERLIGYLSLCTPVGSASAARSFGPGWSFWMQMWSYSYRDAAVREVVPRVYASFATPFAEAIDEGIGRGEFSVADVPLVVDRLVSLIDGCAVRTVLGAMDGERMTVLLIDSLVHDLGLDDVQTRAVRQLADTGGNR
jgi:AcrR family transcriptional regulator